MTLASSPPPPEPTHAPPPQGTIPSPAGPTVDPVLGRGRNPFHRAVGWAFVMNWGQRGLTAVLTFVLAAILGPEAYGTVPLATLYILLIQMLLEQGLATAVIQRRDLAAEHLDSAFWMVLSASVVLAATGVLLSGWWAEIYGLPILRPLIHALSLLVPIQGLTIVQQAVLQRRMEFKALAIRTNVAVVAGGVVGIALALRGFGVWSLVAQQLVAAAVGVLVLWGLSDWRPGLRFSRRATRELLGFSTGSFLARLGVFVVNRADPLIMGALFGPALVGLYWLAYRAVNLLLDLATRSLQAVSFPEFSRLQDDPEAFSRSVLTCMHAGATLTFPALAVLAALSDPLMVALGPDWTDAADGQKVLCLFGALATLTLFLGPVLQAIGRPYFFASIVWIQGAIGVAAFGIVGVALRDATTWTQLMGVAATRAGLYLLLFSPVTLAVAMRHAHVSWSALGRALRPSITASVGVWLAAVAIRATGLLAGVGPIRTLVGEGICLTVLGLGMLWALDGELRRIVRTRIVARLGPIAPAPEPEEDW